MGLAYIAAADGRKDEAWVLLDEADAIARKSSAAGIARQIDEARRHVAR